MTSKKKSKYCSWGKEQELLSGFQRKRSYIETPKWKMRDAEKIPGRRGLWSLSRKSPFCGLPKDKTSAVDFWVCIGVQQCETLPGIFSWNVLDYLVNSSLLTIALCELILDGISRWLGDKESAYPMQGVHEMQVQSLEWEDPWRRKWQPTPIFLPGKSHGQKSLTGHSSWGSQRIKHDWAYTIVLYYAVLRERWEADFSSVFSWQCANSWSHARKSDP